jgi:hypothetical protein
MIVSMDEDLSKVLAFMQANVPAGKLAPVAEELQKISSAIWCRYQREKVAPLHINFLKPPVARKRVAAK